MSDQGKEHGNELSERDLDLRTSGVEGLAVLEAIIEGEAEEMETKLMQQLKQLSDQVSENGVQDVESLSFYDEKLGRDGFGRLLKLNPQYACEYIAGLFRFVAKDFLATKPLNVKDLEFDLADKQTTVELDGTNVSPLSPDNMSERQKDSFASRMMVVGAMEYLIELGLVTNEEFERAKAEVLSR